MKNSKFNTNGNESIDNLLTMTESLSCLSDKFVNKIDNLSLWILTNHKNHVDEIEKSIDDLETGLAFVTIFSTKFIEKVIFLLRTGLKFEINKK